MRSTLAKYLRQYQEEEPFYGQEFGIPRQPHTSSKSIRFPKDLVGTVIGRGESALVVEPVTAGVGARSAQKRVDLFDFQVLQRPVDAVAHHL